MSWMQPSKFGLLSIISEIEFMSHKIYFPSALWHVVTQRFVIACEMTCISTTDLPVMSNAYISDAQEQNFNILFYYTVQKVDDWDLCN